MSTRLASAEDYASLIDKYDTWMFDCDGVLWHGDRLIDGAVDVLRLLRDRSMWSLVFPKKARVMYLFSVLAFNNRKVRFVCYEQRDKVEEELQG